MFSISEYQTRIYNTDERLWNRLSAKKLSTFSRGFFSQEDFIIDVCVGSKYASE